MIFSPYDTKKVENSCKCIYSNSLSPILTVFLIFYNTHNSHREVYKDIISKILFFFFIINRKTKTSLYNDFELRDKSSLLKVFLTVYYYCCYLKIYYITETNKRLRK